MKRAILAAVPVMLVLSACGGTAASDATRTPSESAIKRGQVVGAPGRLFSERASMICSAMDNASKKLVGGGGKASDREIGQMVRRWRADVARLAKLRPPAGKADAFRIMLENYRLLLTGLTAAKTSNDESVLSDLAAVAVAGTRGSRSARRAGLLSCAFFPDIRQPPRDPEPIVTATRALLAPGARVIKTNCIEPDSCRIEFNGSGPIHARLRAAVAILRAHDWSHVRTGRSPEGSTWATAYRNDLAVEIEIMGTRRPPHCVNAPAAMFGCSDALWVHREHLASVLTGG